MVENDFEKYNEKPTQEELEKLALEDNDKFHELVHYYFVNDPIYYIQIIKPVLENLCQHINLDDNTLVNENVKSKKRRKKLLYIFLGIFFIVFITIILILNREDSPEELLNKGKIEVNSGNDSLAILYFNKCIELKADFVEAYNERGYAYYHLRNYDKALQDFNKAIDLKPENPEPYYWRGNVYFESKYYDNAIKDYTKAVELKNNYIAAYNKRGKIYFLQNKYEESLKDLSLVIDNNSTDAEVYFERGFIYNSLKQFKKAVEDFDKAISLRKDYTEAYQKRAEVYISLNEKLFNEFANEFMLNFTKSKSYFLDHSVEIFDVTEEKRDKTISRISSASDEYDKIKIVFDMLMQSKNSVTNGKKDLNIKIRNHAIDIERYVLWQVVLILFFKKDEYGNWKLNEYYYGNMNPWPLW